MAAVTTLNKVSVTLKLNNGTTETGTTKTVSVSLGSLDKTAFNADKVMGIVALLTPCLSLPVLSTNKTESSTLTEGE